MFGVISDGNASVLCMSYDESGVLEKLTDLIRGHDACSQLAGILGGLH